MSSEYALLVELARRERELIDTGRWEDVVTLGVRRSELVSRLPERAPASARHLLEEAAGIVESNVAAIAAASDGVKRELAHLSRGRAALASYGSAPTARRVDARG